MIQNMTGAGGGDIDSIFDDDTKWTQLTYTRLRDISTCDLKFNVTNEKIFLKGYLILNGTNCGYIDGNNLAPILSAKGVTSPKFSGYGADGVSLGTLNVVAAGMFSAFFNHNSVYRMDFNCWIDL